MVGLVFVVVGIGASMICFFWNRWFKNIKGCNFVSLKPIADNNKTNELQIIKKSDLSKITIISEHKKEVEIKPPEKEKAVEKKDVLERIEKEGNKAGNKDVNNHDKEQKIIAEAAPLVLLKNNQNDKEAVLNSSQFKSKEKHSFVSLNSDDLGAPVPADQIKDTNLNGALAPRKDAMASNNNLEENNMGKFWSKIVGSDEEPKNKRARSVEPVRQRFDFSITSSNNDNSNLIDPNDLNNTFEYPNVDKKALNAIGTKVNGLIDKKINDNNKQYDQKLEEVKKDIKDVKEEQINIKAMLANHEKILADNKIRIANSERMLAEMKQQTADIHKQTEEMKEMRKNQEKKYEEDKKEQDEHRKLMAKWFKQLDHLEERRKKPRSNRNENRESTNTSFSSFRGYMNMDNSPTPKMERADMAHSHDEN